LAIAAVLLLAACGGGGGFDDGGSDAKNDQRGSSNARPGNTDGGDDATDGNGGTDGAPADGDGDGSGDSGDSADGGGTTPGPGTTGETGEAYFTRAVLPLLEAKCATCHADPRIKVDVRGPLSIYSYSKLKSFLTTGTSAADNGLLDKIRNVQSHGGGNRCTAGLAATPCKELIAWWQFEMGDDDDQGGTAPSAGKGGKIFDVSSLGRVLGWAADQGDQAAQVTVALYLDGAKGTGTAVGTVKADKAGADGNTPGDHAFQFDLPETARNGKPHKLYAYVDDVLIGGAAFTFTSYAFTKAGRDYYEANVKGQLAQCAGCHTVSYEQQYYSMIAPSPAQGGTATNNQLINKPSQTNGVSHGGGQRCTSANAAPCTQFQQWWKLEFGG
jgi:hypothetical protein